MKETKKNNKPIEPNADEKEVKTSITRINGNKYLRVLASYSELFKDIGERVAKKELKWAFYATENNVATHYFLILNG
jgi:hypothetical protein